MLPGAQDAIVQWWYGHNAVGFLLTGGFLGMLYYFLPKQAEQPIWSYRLSIVAFWAFVYSYIWAGPHHLHYNAIPEWVQSLGVVMSVVLLAPSWATMINGIMTVSNAWQKLRTDPALKFIVLALAFYGLATFEGPMMAIRSVNVMSHFTEWTIGHVHSGALGWNALITFGTFYFLVPRLAGRPLHSVALANTALLARARRHDAVHRVDVGRGPLAVAAVALARRARRGAIQLRRRDARDAAVLSCCVWSAVCCSSPARC